MQSRHHVIRFSFVFLALILCLFVFSIKLVFIQIFNSSHLAGLAERQHNHVIELEPIRGAIYDRNARPLALNVSAYSLYANPRQMSKDDKDKAVIELSSLLGIEESFLQERLKRNKYFVWLKRKLTFETAEKIKSLKITGLDFITESKRYYPNGHLAAHIIGFAGIDNQGLEGAELIYNTYLKGRPGRAMILRDAKQQELLVENHFMSPVDGKNVVLTIDETIQYVAEQALDYAYNKYKAISGSIIVMNIATGEILALANRPTYNLEHARTSKIENRTNRAVSFVYEPGSVFKIVPAAAALEEDYYLESDKIFCENGEYRIANNILHDHHPHGTLSFKDVFAFSSNIGVAKISQKMGPEVIYKYGQRFRFGMKTGIDLRGEVKGVFKEPSRWSKTSIGAIPIGHEVLVTPLQLVTAVGAIANDGLFMKPFVVKYIKDNQDQIIESFEPQVVDRVISEDTARRLKEILAAVVEEGTGKNARIKGVRVAGKTGTAQKVVDGVYSHSKFNATFFGFAPVDDPKLAIVVVLDEPRPSYFGGTVAAPVFKEVMEDSLKYLETSKITQLSNLE